MMKRLSRIALLAAASALMLAVFPACGDDDSEDDPLKKSGTFGADITELDFSVTEGLTDSETDDKKPSKYKIPESRTLIGDGYFTLVQGDKKNSSYYTNNKRDAIAAIELGKQIDGIYIEFTVTGSAEVTVDANSTDTNNTSYVAIVKESETGTFDNAEEVRGTTPTTITKECTAGTYRIVVVTAESPKNKNARITSLKAIQTAN